VEQSGKGNKKKKYARVAAQPSAALADSPVSSQAAGTVFSNDAFHQMRDMLAQCIDQMRRDVMRV